MFARILELGPTEKGARQTRKRDVEYRFVLELDGRRLEHVEKLPAAKTPLRGDSVPVKGTRKGLRIDWNHVPDLADRALASAAAARDGDAAGAAAALGFTLRDS
jgi:hypothetical protein